MSNPWWKLWKHILNLIVFYQGFTRIVENLIERGAKVNAVNAQNDNALILAAWNGNFGIFFFQSHEKLKISTFSNNEEFMQKVSNWHFYDDAFIVFNLGHEKIVKMLIENGADTNVVSSKHETALTLAAVKGKFELL